MQFDHFWHGLYQMWPCHVTEESNEIYIFGKHMQFDHFLAWALTKYGHVT